MINSPESSAAKLAANIELVNSRGLLVVGSLGRAVTFNALAGDSQAEFKYRNETPLIGSGRPRDIDIIGGPIDPEELSSFLPHEVDHRGCFNAEVQIGRAAGEWYIQRMLPGRTWSVRALDSAIFSPVKGHTVLDIPCTTVRPATQWVLATGRAMRRKDKLAQTLLGLVMPEEDRYLLTTPAYQELAADLRAVF
jgi:hypothetical protein